MNRRTLLAGLIVCLCFGAGLHTAVAGPVLIGGGLDGIIYDVDPATGLASNPRDTGLAGLSGLAFSPGGVLYARTGSSTGEDQPNSLYRLNPVTGAPTPLGPIGHSGLEFAFDPITSLLFGTGAPQGGGSVSLYSLDPESLTVDVFGHIPSVRRGLAIDASGGFYVLDGASNELLAIDRDSGAAISGQPLGIGFGSSVGTAFAPDGTLFIVDGGRSPTASLHMFDVSSGVLTTIGGTGLDDGLSSLAYVREPSTLVLLTLSMGVLFTKRSRIGRARPHVFAG